MKEKTERVNYRQTLHLWMYKNLNFIHTFNIQSVIFLLKTEY
jgi:hypothetical protein